MFGIVGGKIAVAFAAAIFVLVVNGIVSFRAVNTLIANNNMVVHTQDVLEVLERTRSTIVETETGQRGYLLTGEERYLAPYTQGAARTGELLRELKTLTADNQTHQSRLPDLERLTSERLDWLRRNINIRRQKGLEAVVNSDSLDRGKEQMDGIRSIISQMEADERQLLAVRIGESRASGRDAVITLIVANLVQLLLVALVLVLTVRDLREKNRSEENLQTARDQLEVRVKERTAQLNELNTELERSNRELQDFAFVASHDLQEPLRKIQAFGDRLQKSQEQNLDEKGRDYLARMHNAAGRMHTLINDLLAFSRVTTKAQPFERTNLSEVAAAVLNDLETAVEQAGGRVDVEELPVIDADPLQMRQLLQNLVANALKFRRQNEPPFVKIESEVFRSSTAEVENGTDLVSISVADNGIGFDEKYLDRIFTPFQRLHGRGEYEGTGIGLAVCRKIVERHGGTLTAKSKEGVGSTFIATLPVKQSKEK